MGIIHNRDYALVVAGSVIVQGTLPLQLVIPIFWVQESTADDIEVLIVGVLSMARGVAMLSLGFYGGALADRFDRRTVLIWAQTASVGTAGLAVAVVAAAGTGPWWVVLLIAVASLGVGLWSVDQATRQALIPELVGVERAPQAIALAAAGTWIVVPLTLLAVGFVIDGVGFAGAFALVGALQVIALSTLLPVRHRRSGTPAVEAVRRESGLRQMGQGIAYTWSRPALRWVVGMSAVMTALVMPAISGLGPTWVTTVVGASFSEFGVIASFWGLGALVASLLLTRFAAPSGPVAAGGALLFAAGFLVFSAGYTPVFAIVGNAAVGAGLVATQIGGVGLIARIAPNEMRARVTSLLLVDRAFAQLLALPAATAAQFAGLEAVFLTLAVCCLAAVAGLLAGQRRLWLHARRAYPGPGEEPVRGDPTGP